jgi:hypothetical protein
MTQRMKFMLAVAAGLIALNLWPSPPSAGAPEEHETTQHVTASTSRTTSASMTIRDLSQQETRPMLEPARRDPFALAPAAKVVVKTPPPPPSVAAVVAVEPSAPPLNLSFAGRITNPEGKQTIYVRFGETGMAIEKGTILPNGYRVENITEDSIELNYLALNTTARLAIPPAPRYETR